MILRRTEPPTTGKRHAIGAIPPTWNAITIAEPRIRQVVEHARPRGRTTNRLLAYETAKRQLYRLVGWGARNPGLRTDDHWNVVMDRLVLVARV